MCPGLLLLRPWNWMSILALAALCVAVVAPSHAAELVLLTILWVVSLFAAIREQHKSREAKAEADAQQFFLQRRNDELLRANEALERFTSVAAHQMRSPPRTIRGMATVLREECSGCDSPLVMQMLDSIIKKADALAEIVTVLHEIGSRHAMAITVRPVELVELLPAARERVGSQYQGKVEFDVPPHLGVLGNDTLLLEMFANLIENGWKFNTSEVPTVKFVARRILDRTRVRVADNGIGLDPKTQGLFELFRRHTDQFPGTGVGLALVKQAVEKQGGFIAVHPPLPGEGAVFVVDLPYAGVNL